MGCYYIIKSPDGGEDIKLSTKFGIIEPDETIQTGFDAIQEASILLETDEQKEELERKLTALIDHFVKNIPDDVSRLKIRNIVTKNMSDLDTMLAELNTLILQSGNLDNINSALVYHIKSKKDNASNLIKRLSKPMKIKYFKGLSMEGVLGVTNIKTEKNKLMARIEENANFGFSNIIPNNLKNFLNGVINSDNKEYKQLLETNILLGTTNTFGGRSLNVDNFTLFNKNDDLSLFLGLFKRVASDIDKETLFNLISELNTKTLKKINVGNIGDFNVFNFFNGTLDDKGKLTLSGFDKLLDLSEDPKIKPYITNILKLVSEHLKSGNTNLFKSIQSLFWSLNPKKYGSEALLNELRQEKFIENEIKDGQKYKNKIISDFLAKNAENNKNEFYSQKEDITTNLFEEASKKLVLNQDIVKLTDGKITPYVVVTGIYPKSNGVHIYGTYKDSFGEYKTINQLFTDKSDTISYRKRENSKEKYNPNEIVTPNTEGLIVSTKTFFNQVLLKRLITKGDIIPAKGGDFLVVGVHAGSLVVSKKDVISEMQYSKVKTFYSKQAQLDMDLAKKVDIKKYVQISDGSLLTNGDLFIDPGTEFYKQILYSDKDTVYSWLQQEGKDTIIKGTPRNTITKGLAYTFGKITDKELGIIKEEIKNIGTSKGTMSSFVNSENAKENDYFTATKDGEVYYGKVTDSENKRGVAINDKYGVRPFNYNDLDVLFLTDRNITSNFWTSISRVNDWKVQSLNEEVASQSKNLKEAQYVIPALVDPNDLILLPSGYANYGKFRDMDAEVRFDEQVVTDHILRLMRESDDHISQEGDKLYVETDDAEGLSRKYKRNLFGIHKINNFNKLAPDVKKELNVLQPGTYFSVFKDISNIYRIISVKDGVVTAHLNKTTPFGKILTTEKQFKVGDLLSSKSDDNSLNDVNSIHSLYLLYGNNKFNTVIEAVNTKGVTKADVSSMKEINATIKKMKTAFKPLKIDVKRVASKDANFTEGQKAKIETDENGKTSILLNKDSGTSTDLVHETLHVYLTLLRYTDAELYNTFLNSVIGDIEGVEELDVTAKEEVFVKTVSEGVKGEIDFISSNLEGFVVALASAIKMINPEFEIDINEAVTNELEILNKSLRDIFNVSLDNSHPMFNLSTITTEPMMRVWMTEQNITLKC